MGKVLSETLTRDELTTQFLRFEGRRLAGHERHAIAPALMARHREAFARVNG